MPVINAVPNEILLRLLATLEQLLAIDATALAPALNEASDVVAAGLSADKVDVFVYDAAIASLVAIGTSNTPMGRLQHELGLERMPLANNDPVAQVYQGARSYLSGGIASDPTVPVGVINGLGARSMMVVLIEVGTERRGVLQVLSSREEAFNSADLLFLEAVARWLGGIMHRADLIEQLARDAAERGRLVAADELVTVLAHDLGNHLTPLQGRMDMIARRARRRGDNEYLGDALAAITSIKRLGTLIRDLLDVARLEQDIFTLELQPTDLDVLVREVAATLTSEAQPVEVSSAEEAPLEADPDRIRQVLENLIANAVKHSPAGLPVTVELFAESRAAGAWRVVTVRDRGAGIPATVLPRLFQRFAPGPGSTGLGLGLYLAQRIAHAHGGTLEVVTSPERGTEFRLALPAEQRAGSR